MAKRQPQPARASYFFGKGYRDLGGTIAGAWSRNINSAKRHLQAARDARVLSFRGALHLVAALCVFFYGTIITVFTSVIHIGILFAFFVLVYLGFALVYLIDSIYTLLHKIKNACPNSSCQASFRIPVYECDQCGAKHTRLVPGKYGILKRRCNCGAKLPTTFMNGRGKLKAYCPDCGQSLSGDTASRQYAIPVIGGPSVGKTCYINMAIDQLMNDVATDRNWEVNFITEEDKQIHASTMAAMRQGSAPLKTESEALTAYQMMIKLPKEKIGRRVYVYDIAGERFATSGDVQKNNAYTYADGFIFLIDPLSIARFAGEVQDEINIDSYRASSKDFDDILNIMLINLEKMFGLSSKDMIKMNLAVVINKCDIPGLDEKVGDVAVEQYLADHPEVTDRAEAKNAVCKEFLENYDAGNFVRAAESKFKCVQYFTSSALGHNKEGVPYEGKNVVEPLLWIMSKVDTSISA